MTSYEMVVGIEVHAQLKTKTKLFCASSTRFGDAPNTNISPVNLGLPGALPVLNKEAVRMAVLAGLALNCSIRTHSVFSRKNYFYPDLPKGYQISQFDLPICENGHLDITLPDGSEKRIGITRIHMEEDAGKLLHQGADAIHGASHSLVDLNRAGVPLIEIVSEPDIRSIEEARAYVEALKWTVQHIGVCDGNLEEGSMRADINISLRPQGQKEFGTRTEIKNINSFRSLERAMSSEIKRQTRILNEGGTIIQQTRNYDDATQTTTPLRDKEDAHDYRYFPEPDLIPLKLTYDYIEDCSSQLPELPLQKKKRFQESLQLSEEESRFLISELDICQFFEDCVALGHSGKDVAKWVLGDLLAMAKRDGLSFSALNVTPTHISELIHTIEDGTLSGKMAKDVLMKMYASGSAPKTVISELGMSQISDTSQLDSVIESVLAANPDVVEKFKNGKTNVIGFIMGQVMKETRGQAKPDLVKELVLKRLNS